MSDTKRILSYIRRACDDYNMIEEGDKIAIGISGGKDSLTLLTALAEMRRFYPKKYSLCGISIDMGLEGMDFSAVADYCRSLDVEYHIIPSDISKVVFEYRKEHNPCSLCAKMRRGALNNAAHSLGCNKVALGHHFDDVVETFMLNLFFEGRIGVFSPVTYLSRSDVTVMKFDGMRNPKVVASSEGRNAETISPTGFTGLPRPTWQRVSSWRSVVRRKM